jgi:hypothetical protein
MKVMKWKDNVKTLSKSSWEGKEGRLFSGKRHSIFP